jgi:hydrogenase expression/formation protein HypE
MTGINETTNLISCPLPMQGPFVNMAHGGGGRMMHRLIRDVFLGGDECSGLHDGAVIESQSNRLAYTTDSFVVRPLVFPGGDVGKLAVCGTVNDLAMCGARPTALSAGFVVEESFRIEDLARIARSMRQTADDCGVRIVTGDTKVVERGHGDGVYINTSGIGWLPDGIHVGPAHVQAGDVIILSGDIGRHGIALLAAREGLDFRVTIVSDCAPLHEPVMRLIDANIELHCLRDLTRGGLAAALVEIAESRQLEVQIRESDIPVCGEVHAACEVLGFDPLHIANEGRFCAFVPPAFAARALEILRSHPVSMDAQIIGHVLHAPTGLVTMHTAIGTDRIVDMPSGEILPRIC